MNLKNPKTWRDIILSYVFFTLLAFVLGFFLSCSLVDYDDVPEDDQEDSADSAPCFEIDYTDNGYFLYTELSCDKEVTL